MGREYKSLIKNLFIEMSVLRNKISQLLNKYFIFFIKLL
jgi:hypothetical protein